MTSAAQVLDVARSRIGTVEDRRGATEFSREYGLAAGQPWCAVFCWWVFRHAGAPGLIHPKTAYTPTAAGWFRERGAFDRNPRVGDLVFYNWPDSIPRIQHVGIVEAVEAASIVTIEGNTMHGTAGDQSNGGGVWRRRRARNSSIAGFGHPAYTAAAAATETPRRRDNVVQNIVIAAGSGNLRLIVPTGGGAVCTERAWISLVVNGPRAGKVRAWAQTPTAGIADTGASKSIGFTDGRSESFGWELPAGTHQVNVQYELPDGGTLCIETLARR